MKGKHRTRTQGASLVNHERERTSRKFCESIPQPQQPLFVYFWGGRGMSEGDEADKLGMMVDCHSLARGLVLTPPHAAPTTGIRNPFNTQPSCTQPTPPIQHMGRMIAYVVGYGTSQRAAAHRAVT